jgi:hypothetical protein
MPIQEFESQEALDDPFDQYMAKEHTSPFWCGNRFTPPWFPPDSGRGPTVLPTSSTKQLEAHSL